MNTSAAGSAQPDAIATDVLDALPDAVVVLVEGPTVAFVNRAAEGLFGVGRAQLVGRRCADAVPITDAQGRNVCHRSPVGRTLPMIKGVPETDYQLTRPSGEFVPITIRCAYMKDDANVVRQAICTIRDARARRGMDLRTVELISTVSHEIRSPLTSIKGFTKTLLDRWDRFDDEMKREMLVAVNTDADRVTRLLGELLDISRLEAGRLRLRPKRFDLAALAHRVAEAVKGLSEEHTIEVSFPDAFPEVFADPDKVQQVLTNLTENAVKYTDGGRVRVTGTVDGSTVCVSVSDEGEGISAAALPRLFRKFYRRERAGSPTGTGLGLYICKGLVEAHGGQISVSSLLEEGTTFSFTLPVTRDQVP